MKSLSLKIASLLLAAMPTVAMADKPVGTTSIETSDETNARRFVNEFWFEAAPTAKVESFTIRLPIKAIKIARNAEPAAGQHKRPLVVLSHGNWGTRYSLGWLSMRLVNAGYVVLSISHPGTLGEDQTVAGRLRLWDRSRDVTFALSEILKHPKWSALIDETRIAFAGYSFGGWTGVSLAGGRFDPLAQRTFCEKSSPRDGYCDLTLKDDITGIQTADATESFKDARFKAFYIMASGPGQGFSEASLRSIVAPFLVETARDDDMLETSHNSRMLARVIPGAQEIVRPVGHFVYVPECKWLIGPLLARVAGVPICDDPSSVDRALVHRKVSDDVIAFFNKHLAAANAAAVIAKPD